MDKNINEKTTVESILAGEKDFFSLNFDRIEDREIGLNCLDRMQLLALRLNIDIPSHLELLKLWIKRKFENLLILAPEQRCTELVNIFLEEKFKRQLSQQSNPDPFLVKSVSMMHSYSKQLVVCYNYETKEGEVISYFDKVLQIPVKLNTNAALKLKLVDGLKFVKALDIELDYVDLHATVNLINSLMVQSIRASLLEIICDKNVSYYDMPQHLEEIRGDVSKRLTAEVEKYGLQLAELKINDISLINRIDEQLEKQYYALAKLSQRKQFEYRLEEESLKLYEKKAMIHAAYPDFEPGMTEAEKDFALERYLQRKDKSKDLEVEVQTQKTAKRLTEHTGAATTVMINKPVAPVPPVKQNIYRIMFIIMTLLWVAATITLFAVGELESAAIAVLCVGAAAVAAFGYLYRYQLRYGLSKKAKNDYEDAVKTYEKLLAEYNAYNQNDVKQAQYAPVDTPEQPTVPTATETPDATEEAGESKPSDSED